MTEDQGFVLVVDDEEDNREVLGRRLQRQGFRVAYAKGGREALVAIGAQSFDVVLLDIMMPDVDGKSVLKIARRTYSSTQLPIIMATARHGGESVIETLELGANDYVSKPLDFPVVLARVRAAVGRKRAEDGMKRLRLQMEGILNAVPEGICGLDVGGLCTFSNKGLAELCGVEGGELLGGPLHDRVHPVQTGGARCDAATCPLFEVLRDGEAHQGRDVLWTASGEAVPVDWAASPVRELDALAGAVLTVRDLRRQPPGQGVRDGLMGWARQGLRPGLISVRGAVELLGALPTLGSRGQYLVEQARHGTDRLVNQLNTLIDLDSLAHRAGPLEQVACDAADLLVEAVEPLEAAAQAAEVTLTTLPQPARIQAEPRLLVEALQHLVGNAVRYSPRGSVVQVGVQAEGQEVVFWIEDQGRGVPAHALASLLDGFRRVYAADADGAAGGGLALCRTVAERHGGRLWATSAPGQGSTFYLAVPLARQAEAVVASDRR